MGNTARIHQAVISSAAAQVITIALICFMNAAFLHNCQTGKAVMLKAIPMNKLRLKENPLGQTDYIYAKANTSANGITILAWLITTASFYFSNF
jgi:hypothetical protein